MALTKVSGGILDPGINVAGIVTATGFDGPFTGGSSKNITAGIITATGFDLNGNGDISGNLVIGGNLTANGDFTTLNTTLREVEILRVDANTTAVAGIITQRGSGDILRLYDDSTQVVTVLDTGEVGINVSNPSERLHVYHATENLVAKFESGDAGAGIIFKDNTHSTTLQSNNGAFEINVDNGTDITGETISLKLSGSEKLHITKDGHITPGSDNSQNIGSGTTNFASVWASTRFRGNDDVKLILGNSQDLVIRHTGSYNAIEAPQGHNTFIRSGTGDNANLNCARFDHAGSVYLLSLIHI